MRVDQWVLYAGGVAVAVTAIATIGRGAWRIYRRFDAFFEDWFGQPERPGRPRIPGMPERVRRLEQGLRQVRRQVTPNGGNTQTLGDKVARIEHHVGAETTGIVDVGGDHDTDHHGGS